MSRRRHLKKPPHKAGSPPFPIPTPPPTRTPPPPLHEVLPGLLVFFLLFYVISTRPLGTLRTIWFCLWYAGVGLVGHVVFCIAWWEERRKDADRAASDRGVMESVREVVVMKEEGWEVVVRGGSGGEGVVRN